MTFVIVDRMLKKENQNITQPRFTFTIILLMRSSHCFLKKVKLRAYFWTHDNQIFKQILRSEKGFKQNTK